LNRRTASLLTGFPASRARNLLQELTRRHPDAEVVALVHPSRLPEARAVADELGLADTGRVTLLEGDPCAMDFGLPGAEYLRLSARVRVVHGAYSITDPDVADGVESLNVGAARELVEFARAAPGLERLVLYSSVFVSGDRSGHVAEDELEAGQGFRNPTERSLAIAERIVRKSELPFNVLRAGHLLGTGAGDPERVSGPHLFAAILLSAPDETPLPIPPFAEARLPLTPLRYLAELGVATPGLFEPGITIHAVDPRPLTLGDFVRLLAEALGRSLDPGFNPGTMTRALLGNPIAKLLPKNRRGLLEILTTGGDYDTKRAAESPLRGGPDCPHVSEYLGALLDDVRRRVDAGALYPKPSEELAFLVA